MARIFSASSRNFWSSSIRRSATHGVLVEPTSVVAKAWDHTERIGRRSRAWQPKTLLVTGAGPIGLLAALIGAQRGLDVHVLDHHDSVEKRAIVRELGGTFHLGKLADLDALKPDILMECTGAPSVVRDALGRTASGGIVCLVGVSRAGSRSRRRYRQRQSHHGARQRHGVRQRQRQPQALRRCRRGACSAPTRLGSAA